MNDDELMTSVRDTFTGVHSATPVEQIISRGRAVRARRRIPGRRGLAGGRSGHCRDRAASAASSSAPARARLAAWTVTELANGNISVTSASCATRPGCNHTSAPMVSRPASRSPASRTRRARHTPTFRGRTGTKQSESRP